MQAIHIIQLITFAGMLSCGQILFKKTAEGLPPLLSFDGALALLLNLWFWAALVLYGLSTLLWIFILQKVPLSMAYPFVALGFVVVPLASWFLFKEPLNWGYAGGVALILTGLGVITLLGPEA